MYFRKLHILIVQQKQISVFVWSQEAHYIGAQISLWPCLHPHQSMWEKQAVSSCKNMAINNYVVNLKDRVMYMQEYFFLSENIPLNAQVTL